MAKFFIDRPVFAIVISIFIVLGGLIAGFNLPIAQYPQITPPTINVSANYAGANAEVVEQGVAQVIELQVNGAEDMVAMSSTSSDNGIYSLDVKFELGKDADLASVQTQNRVSQANAQLPSEVTASGIVTRKASRDMAMIFSLWSPNGSYDRGFMKNYGSIYILEDLKRVKGVGNVSEFASDYSMRIWLQPDKMAQLGITTTDVAAALRDQNVQAPVGGIGQQPAAQTQEMQYSARVKGRLENAEEFGQIIVRTQSDGSFTRIKDIARVEMGNKDYFFASHLNGMESVAFAIQLASDANALDTIREAQEILERASQAFPPDLQYSVVVDNTRFVRESLTEVAKTFFEALFLVIVILFIFLQNWRATLIPTLAVPVSLIGTLGAFLMLGFSINTLTLFAMVMAIGTVVDDAIVVVEAVEYNMRVNGLSPREATYRTMEEVAGPCIAMAAVLISVFMPVAFMGGTVGVLYKQFALTMCISVALSALVALTLTPALCAMILKPHQENGHSGKTGKYLGKFNVWFEGITQKYESGVVKMMLKAKVSIVLMIFMLIGSSGLSKLVPSTFVPAEDQGFFITTVTLPEAASLNRTQDVANQVATMMRSIEGITNTIVISGYDILGGAIKSNTAVVFTQLAPWSERNKAELAVDKRIMAVYGGASQFAEANVMAFNAPTLPGVGTFGGFSFMLQDRAGNSVEELNQTTQQFLAAARQRPELAMIYSTFRTDTPSLRFDVDREKAQKMGVPVSSVFGTLQTYLGGLQVNDFNRFGRTYKVVLQADAAFRSDANDLRSLYVRSNTGVMVPLSTLVNPVPINSPTSVKRFNGFRAVQIGGNPAPGYSTGQVMQALEEVAAQTLPSGYSYEWADQSREEKMSGGRTPIIFTLAIIFAFLCLAALYESWTVPFSVLLSVPAAIFGSFLFQAVRGLENSVYMQIGIVMLIGLVARNAILIVEFAKIRVEHGMSFREAAVEAARIRLRPIMMTALTFIIGCMPLMFASGAGAGSRHAMGTTVVGGMMIGTFIGIFVIPSLYVVVEEATEFARGFFKKTKQATEILDPSSQD